VLEVNIPLATDGATKPFIGRVKVNSLGITSMLASPHSKGLFVLKVDPKIIQEDALAVGRAITDWCEGNDISWARVYRTSKVQKIAVYSDNSKNKDLTWARTSKLSGVRKSAAHADFRAGRDLSWTATDKCSAVRQYLKIEQQNSAEDLKAIRAKF